jgi:hypothetical protein
MNNADNDWLIKFHAARARKQRDEECLNIVKNAAVAGDADAQHMTGLIYCQYLTPALAEIDWTEARYWFQLAADQGHEGSLFELGLIYKHGESVEKDWGLAAQYFSKKISCPNSLFQLGYLSYHGGINLARNYEKSTHYFRESIRVAIVQNDSLHYAACLYYLGLMHFQGHGLIQSFSRAYVLLAAAGEICRRQDSIYRDADNNLCKEPGKNERASASAKLHKTALEKARTEAKKLVRQYTDMNERAAKECAELGVDLII